MSEQPHWLVQTKLQPPRLHADTIERRRLLTALAAAVSERPVTLISAPAGYGKTTLLASLPALLPDLPLAWVTLDSEDNDPARFLTALIAALQRLHPEVGAQASQHVGGEPRRAMGLLINELLAHLSQPFALVLDDLHLVTAPAVHVALDYLIEHLPPQLHLVIATRHDPPLPLARLVARRQLTEFRRPQLSFTPDEARRLLNDTLGLELAAADLAALTSRTEGWAAGLCLLASSLEGAAGSERRSALLQGLSATRRYVFDFLAEEVLSSQDPGARTFLLQTSILPQLTPALCQAVTGRADAGALLEQLYRKNLFLVADESGAYRYHALFAEFLRQQLARELPDQVAELHRLAAGAQGATDRAVAHYLAAGLWSDAAQSIVQLGQQFIGLGMSATVRGWGQALPAAVRDQHPGLCLLLASAAVEQGDFAAAQTLARTARSAAAGNPALAGMALSILSVCAHLQNNMPALRDLTAQALAMPLPANVGAALLPARIALTFYDRDWDGAAALVCEALALAPQLGDPRLTVSLAYHLAPPILMLPGCLEPGERFCQTHADAAPAMSSLRLASLDTLTFVHLVRGRLDQALQAGAATLAIKEALSGYAWLGPTAAMYRATIHTLRGERALAEGDLSTLLTLVEQAPTAQLQVWLYGAARTAWLLGDPDTARRLLERMRQTDAAGAMLSFATPLQHRLAGLLALGERRYAEAEGELRQAVAQHVPMLDVLGHPRLWLARLHLERGQSAAALAEVQPLLVRCEAEETPGLLLQEGALIVPVLRLAAAGGAPGSTLAAQLVPLLSEAIAPAAPAPAVAPSLLPEALTGREIEVLHLLSGGASNREIAATLIVGEETVKTHVARILRKLDVDTRTRAAARARELGLI